MIKWLGILLFMLSGSSWVWASPFLDRQYQLETIGYLRSWDNVDDIFSNYVSTAYQDFLSKNHRFVWVDLDRVGDLLKNSKAPYKQVIFDPEILTQIAQTHGVSTLIRTTIEKRGPRYQVAMEWLIAPQMERLTVENFTFDEPLPGTPLNADFLLELFKQHLEKLVAQVPFLGQVTGRDGGIVTVNLGQNEKLQPGDVLELSTIQSVKQHPLLKKIVDWKMEPIGKIVVDQVEDSLSFCKILEEDSTQEIVRYQKVTRVRRKPVVEPIEAVQEKPIEAEVPSQSKNLGWLAVSLFGGGHEWQTSSAGGALNQAGGGLAWGGKAEAEAWITREWFANLDLGYVSWSLVQKDLSTGSLTAASSAGGISASTFLFRLNAGYSYFFTKSFHGPRAWAKLGYQSNAYTLPISSVETTGPLSIGSIFLGLGGESPIYGPWGAFLNLNFRLVSFVNQAWVGADATGASDVGLSLGATYQWTPRMKIRAALDWVQNGADFSSAASIGQKTITFGPSLLYYF